MFYTGWSNLCWQLLSCSWLCLNLDPSICLPPLIWGGDSVLSRKPRLPCPWPLLPGHPGESRGVPRAKKHRPSRISWVSSRRDMPGTPHQGGSRSRPDQMPVPPIWLFWIYMNLWAPCAKAWLLGAYFGVTAPGLAPDGDPSEPCPMFILRRIWAVLLLSSCVSCLTQSGAESPW